METFNLEMLNDMEVKQECQVKVSHRSAAFENVSDDADISKTWDSIRENMETLNDRESRLL
jgi:hypothetical protein